MLQLHQPGAGQPRQLEGAPAPLLKGRQPHQQARTLPQQLQHSRKTRRCTRINPLKVSRGSRGERRVHTSKKSTLAAEEPGGRSNAGTAKGAPGGFVLCA